MKKLYTLALILSALVALSSYPASSQSLRKTSNLQSPISPIPTILDELYLGVPAGNGHGPQRLALDSAGQKLYTLNQGLAELNEGNTLSTIDLTTNEVTGLIQLDTRSVPPAEQLQSAVSRPSPLDLQLDPYRPHLYALTGDPYASPPYSTLTIIDLDTGRVADTLPDIYAFAPGPDRLYLANASQLWAVDPVSLAVLASTNLQSPREASNLSPFLLLNPTANRLYLGQKQPGALAVFTADSLASVGSYTGPAQLIEAVVDESAQQLWLIDSDEAQLTLRALDGDGQPLTDPAPFILTDDTYSNPHLALIGSTLAVTNRTIDAHLLQFFDKSDLSLTTDLTIPGSPADLIADPFANRLYAVYADTSSYVLAVDPASGAAETIFTARLIKAAQADPEADRLYILDDQRTLRALSLTDSDEIARLNLQPDLQSPISDLRPLTPDPQSPSSLALDPARQRLYLSGSPAQVIDTAAFTLTATLDTPGQLTPDPASDRLYLTPPCQCRTEQCNTLILSAETLTGTDTLFPLQDPLIAPCVIETTLDPQNQLLYALIYNGVAGSNSGNTFSAFDVSGPPQPVYEAGQISYYGHFALDPDRQRAFISRGRPDRSFIERFELQGQTLTQTLELAGAAGLLFYDPPRDRLYTVNGPALQVFDGDLTLLSEIALPGAFTPLTFDSAAQRLYLSDSNANLLIVETSGGQLDPPPSAVFSPQPASSQLFSTPAGDYFRLDNGRLYHAQGQSWTLLGQGLPDRFISAFAISPNYQTDRTLLAGLSAQGRNGGLFRSSDGGDTWQPSTRGLTDLEISQIVFSPTFAQDRTIFLTTPYRGLFRSTDGGDTWLALAGSYTTDPTEAQLSDLAVSPTFAQDKLVLISGRTLLRSSDGGDTWTDTGLPPGQIAFSPNFARDKLVLSAGRWRSTDGGETWQPAAAGLEPNSGVRDLFFSPTFAADQTVFVLLSQAFDQPLKLQRSIDAGRTWQSLLGGLPANFELVAATILPGGELYLTDQAGPQPLVVQPQALTWGRPSLDLSQLDLQALAATPDGLLFVANSTAGVLKSTDGGRTWQDTNFPARADETRVAQLALAGNDALFAATGTIIERSTDGGQTWTYLAKLPAGFEVTALAVSPSFASAGVVLTGGNYASRQILRSADGGQTWQVVYDGSSMEGASDIGAIAFSPNFAGDKTAYAWLQYGGLLRSTDGGQSWALVPSDKSNAVAQTLVVSKEGRLYLGALYGGLYISDNGGQSWLDLSAAIPGDRTWSSAIAFGPNNSLFLGTDIGVYRSDDGGQTWSAANTGLPLDPDLGTPQGVRALAFSGERLYAALTKNGIFVSEDQGQSWRSALAD